MKKIQLLLLLSLLLFGIQDIKAQKDNEPVINTIRYDKDVNDSILYGACDMGFIRQFTPYAEYFNMYFDEFTFSQDSLMQYHAQLNTVDITIVMGSWCSDSQEQVPKLLKIYEEMGGSEERLKVICVDRNKEVEGIDIQAMDIKLVPTFIISRDGKEIGRIIETPEYTMVRDLRDILKQLDE